MIRILTLLAGMLAPSIAVAQSTTPCPPGFPPGARCTTRAQDQTLTTPSRVTGLSTSDGRMVTVQTILGLLQASDLSPLLGPAALLPVGTTAGTLAAGNDARILGALQAPNNLSDMASASAARLNLGLGPLAVLGIGAGLASSGGNLVAAVQSVFGRTGLVALLGSDVTGALGYTPYSAANPSGYINAAGAPVQSVNSQTGTVTITRSGLGAAASGANSDITSLAGLTTALSVAQGGTGGNTAATARVGLGLATVAATGAYADLSGRPTLGGAAALNVGTAAGTVADGSVDPIARSAIQPAAIPSTAVTAPLCGSGAAGSVTACGSSTALPSGTTAATQAAGDNSTKAATTGYADRAVGTETARATTAEALLAPLASPALTGTPTAPTPTTTDSSTKVATTGYVQVNLGNYLTTANAASTYCALGGTCTLTGNLSAASQLITRGGSGDVISSNAAYSGVWRSISSGWAWFAQNQSGALQFYASPSSVAAGAPLAEVPTLRISPGATTVNGSLTAGAGVNQAIINGSASGVPIALTATGTNTPAAIIPTGTGFLASAIPDSTTAGGNARGANAVDWSTVRGVNTQVASGARSVVAGGGSNAAGGVEATVSGGSSNVASGPNSAVAGGYLNSAGGGNAVAGGGYNTANGTYATVFGGGNSVTGANSSIPGGLSASDRGRTGVQCFGSGVFATLGDAQTCVHVLRATTSSTTATRLTADAGAPGSANCVNIPGGIYASLKIQAIATDNSGNAGFQTWDFPQSYLIRAPAGNVSYSGTAATTLGAGTGTSATLSAAADTTNQCLSLAFTAPNTNTWHVVARVTATEVQ